jgi:N utilization substance protein A
LKTSYTTEARKNEADFEIGEEVSEEVKLIDLGRRAILALPNLISKIHEHDNTNLYSNLKILLVYKCIMFVQSCYFGG